MVSALASSSVRFPLSVSVKVLVSDCDLLRDKVAQDFILIFPFGPINMIYTCLKW